MATRGKLTLVALGLLAACSPGAETNNQAAPANPPAATPAPLNSLGEAEPTANQSSDAQARIPAAAPAVALSPTGLSVNGGSGPARTLAFGAPEAEAVRVIRGVLGEPVERFTNAECGAGPTGYVRFRGRFDLLTDGGRFVGWAADERIPIATTEGIGVGSTRRELEAAYDVEVEESTLGTEFNGEELGGILSSAAPDARITGLWAGRTCLFR